MSDVIKLLPDSVANQIAAGEVIQRPASVVKELVENAVDAGATRISIILKDAGRTLIQVVDNGCGMSPTDARLAFERHSTSKIRKADDLFTLHTMGFRGEALASICAVAQVELITMPEGETLGTCIEINGSKIARLEPCAATKGSNMSVKNLFFNVPARRKFLKKDSVEMSNILHEFERLALVNPDVDFELISDNKLLHNLLRGPLKQRIGELFGKTVERQLIPVEVKTPLVEIRGFVGLPENARRRNALQYLFVNGRNMRHPYFHKAVLSCYEKLIAADVQPNYFLNFTVDPSTIDVNIHPTKNEIKFENESAIWQILVAAIRNTLGKFNVAPAMDFEDSPVDDIPPFLPTSDPAPLKDSSFDYNPFAETKRSGGNNAATYRSSMLNAGNSADNWEKLYDGFHRESKVRKSVLNSPISDEFDFSVPSPSLPETETPSVGSENKVIQFNNKFIITPVKSGIMIVDQHRAHLLVLFNSYLASLRNNREISSQQLIFPEMVTLTPAQNILLDSIIDIVESLGYNLSYLNDNTWSINGVPTTLGTVNPKEALIAIIDDVASIPENLVAEVNAKVALGMARASAITAGRTLTSEEMDTLLTDLLLLPEPNYTPEGQPVISIITTEELLKRF